MAFSLALGVISFAEEESGELKVSQAKLVFADCVYLLIAVDYTEVGSADDITLKITNNNTGAVTVLAPDSSIDAPEGCVAFKYTDLGAKNMGDELSLQAFKGEKASGAAKTYSILEYALRAENEADAKLYALVESMIAYGASAQAAWGYEGTYDLSVDYSLVRLLGGAKFADGSTKAIMKEGDTLTATKTDAAATDVWYNSRVQQRGTGSSIEVTYHKDNETLFVTAAPTAAILGAQVDYEKMAAAVPDGIWFEDINNVDSWWQKDENGDTVKYNGSAKPNAAPVTNPGQQFIVHKNDSIEFTSNGVATSASASAFRFSSLGLQAALTEIVKDPNAKAFTVSMTFAAGDIATDMFSYFSLRINKNTNPNEQAFYKDGVKQTNNYSQLFNAKYTLEDGSRATPIGRLSFLMATANTIGTYHKADGKSNSMQALGTSYGDGSSLHTAGEYITVHAVFVFETETEGMRIDYYVNDNPNVLASVKIDMMIKSDFASGGWYIDSSNDKNVQCFLKACAVTSGNIADNFK